VVSDVEKALFEASGRDQEDERERIIDDVSLFNFRWHQNRGVLLIRGRVWRIPVYWPDGVRHGGDVSLICRFCMERGKACLDTAALRGVREGALQAADTARS
jgi:hypothetical protein